MVVTLKIHSGMHHNTTGWAGGGGGGGGAGLGGWPVGGEGEQGGFS